MCVCVWGGGWGVYVYSTGCPRMIYTGIEKNIKNIKSTLKAMIIFALFGNDIYFMF